MEIIETNLQFRGSMSNRASTTRIILHHAEASECRAEDIHRWHLGNGWSGAGYHFLVRKDGRVYRLRPEGKIGAHASGSNFNSIGICFEGRYQTETMPEAQVQAGHDLLAYLKDKYAIVTVCKHSDVCDTDCPGANFPFDAIVNGLAVVEPEYKEPVKKPAEPVGTTSGYDGWIGTLQNECNKQGFSDQKVDGIAGPITLAGCPTLGRSSQGEITRLVQQRLNHLGYSCGAEDGINGPNTQRGIKAFQSSKGLIADGIVGPNTWTKLLGL